MNEHRNHETVWREKFKICLTCEEVVGHRMSRVTRPNTLPLVRDRFNSNQEMGITAIIPGSNRGQGRVDMSLELARETTTTWL